MLYYFELNQQCMKKFISLQLQGLNFDYHVTNGIPLKFKFAFLLTCFCHLFKIIFGLYKQVFWSLKDLHFFFKEIYYILLKEQHTTIYTKLFGRSFIKMITIKEISSLICGKFANSIEN